jgi:hypothetical protein
LIEVAWLRGHDAEAARVADAGLAFAERYISKRARNCFMQRVLQGLAARMGFEVRCDDGGGAPCNQSINHAASAQSRS